MPCQDFAASLPQPDGGEVTRSDSGTTAVRTDVQKAAMAVGAVFLLVGVLGFIPGITSDYSDMTFAGHDSTAKLLGIFQVSILHNIVHLLFGVAGIAMARQARTAYLYLVGGGVIYLVLWLYGLIIDKDSDANFVPVNTADNWLHLLLGLGMIALGVLLSRRSAAADGRTGR
jgi:4-hydroxybenzoate polyprenyltransferase